MSDQARLALDRFRNAGSEQLATAQNELGRLTAFRTQLSGHRDSLFILTQSVAALAIPLVEEPAINATLAPASGPSAERLLRRLKATLRLARMLSHRLDQLLATREGTATVIMESRKSDVQTRLVQAGESAESLNQFAALVEVATQHEAKSALFNASKLRYCAALKTFATLRKRRRTNVGRRRALMQRAVQMIDTRFESRIRLEVHEDGVLGNLDRWLRELRNTGVTRWWNDRSKQRPTISPDMLRASLGYAKRGNAQAPALHPTLAALGMTAQVSASFVSAINPTRRFHLASIRNEDRYNIQLRVTDSPPSYKEMGRIIRRSPG